VTPAPLGFQTRGCLPASLEVPPASRSHVSRSLDSGRRLSQRPADNQKDIGMSVPVEERFWSKVNFDGPVPECAPHLGPCWLWTASLVKGYGQFFVNHKGKAKRYLAHRLAYLLAHGEINPKLDLDHLCRVRACIHPWHTEQVTRRVNLLRGIGISAQRARVTHCPRGHEYTPENTWLSKRNQRTCRACKKQPSRRKTACVRGHPFDDANTYRYPDGRNGRKCRTCAVIYQRERRARRAA